MRKDGGNGFVQIGTMKMLKKPFRMLLKIITNEKALQNRPHEQNMPLQKGVSCWNIIF